MWCKFGDLTLKNEATKPSYFTVRKKILQNLKDRKDLR